MEKPKVIIVDENDNPIGAKFRNEIDHTKDIYRWSAVWIENSKGEVLIAQRKFTKDKDPGKWGPAVAGTIEEGETYESNAHKEAEEELGLTNLTLQLGPKEHADTPRRYFGQWFLCMLDKPVSDLRLQEDEVEQVAWIDKKQLAEEIRTKPEKYVPAMANTLGVLL